MASGSLNQPLDLLEIHRSFPQSQYNPEEFPGLVLRLDKPKASTLLFNTGKLVCTGTKSQKQLNEAIDRLLETLNSHGIKIHGEPVVEIQNIVASGYLGGTVRLHDAATKLPKSMYEPEQFPGLIHRMSEPKTVFLLFASGKFVCTGAKQEAVVFEAVKRFHARLDQDALMIY